jgi:hypothetical protein
VLNTASKRTGGSTVAVGTDGFEPTLERGRSAVSQSVHPSERRVVAAKRR